MNSDFKKIYDELIKLANINLSNEDLIDFLDSLKALDLKDETIDTINFCIDKIEANEYRFKDLLETFS